MRYLRTRGWICYLTLNRPQQLNTLNAQLMNGLREALETTEAHEAERLGMVGCVAAMDRRDDRFKDL